MKKRVVHLMRAAKLPQYLGVHILWYVYQHTPVVATRQAKYYRFFNCQAMEIDTWMGLVRKDKMYRTSCTTLPDEDLLTMILDYIF